MPPDTPLFHPVRLQNVCKMPSGLALKIAWSNIRRRSIPPLSSENRPILRLIEGSLCLLTKLGLGFSSEMVHRYTRSITFNDAMKLYRAPLS